MKIDNLAARIETIAPLTMQEPWDHSGWQLRLTDGEIHSVLIALEINEQVIDEAIDRGAELILTHHRFCLPQSRKLTAIPFSGIIS